MLKRLDENFDERKKNATSSENMWRGGTLFYRWTRKFVTWTHLQARCECSPRRRTRTCLECFVQHGRGIGRLFPISVPGSTPSCRRPTRRSWTTSHFSIVERKMWDESDFYEWTQWVNNGSVRILPQTEEQKIPKTQNRYSTDAACRHRAK